MIVFHGREDQYYRSFLDTFADGWDGAVFYHLSMSAPIWQVRQRLKLQ